MSATNRQLLSNCAASLLVAIGAMFLAAPLRAAPSVQAWVQRYPGAEGTKIAVDPDGNVVVAGTIGSSGPGLIIKYSSHGVGLWTNVPDAGVLGLALDSDGTVYVTGCLYISRSEYDYLTTAYSTAGIPLWTNRYSYIYWSGSPIYNHAIPSGVVVGSSNKVYVAGTTWGDPQYEASGMFDFATVAYSQAGAPLWTNRYDGTGNGFYQARAVAVGGNGNIYVTGYRVTGSSFSSEFVTIAYTTVGVPLWVNRYGTLQNQADARALAVDDFGHVYVVGRAQRSSNSYVSDYDYTTIAYSTNGSPLWTNRFSISANGDNEVQAVGVDRSGKVYLTGYAGLLNSSNTRDYVTIAYSSSGTPLWTNRYDGPGNTNDYARALAVGSDGTVYVSGYSWGAGSFYDYLTLAYSSDGVPLWTNRFNGPGNGYDQAFAMAVDGSGNIYVTGYSQGDCTTIKYVPAPSILFSEIDLVPGPACRLTITAPTKLVFRLEASTNLADWLALTNYSDLPVSTIQYTDTLAPGFPQRYYRTAWAP